MHNIIKIALRDFKKIRTNLIAAIVIMGITIVPSLYAWFNIAASWDPYGNTGNLNVAIANSDDGYDGELMPINVNIGERVESALRENASLNWSFVSEKEAIDGVKSGEYYAAIVIPESFSDDMMSIFSPNAKHSDIIYYINEKENAIAPKVTEKGASTLQKKIDREFSETILTIGVNLMKDVSTVVGDGESLEAVDNISDNLRNTQRELRAGATTLRSFETMIASLDKLFNTTDSLLGATKETSKANRKAIASANIDVDGLVKSVDAGTNQVNTILNQTGDCYDQMADEVDTAFASVGNDAADIAAGLDGVNLEVKAIIEDMKSYRDSLQQILDVVKNDPGILPDDDREQLITALNSAIGKLDASIEAQENLSQALTDASANLTTSVGDSEAYRTEVKKLIEQARKSIDGVNQTYEKQVKKQLNTLAKSLNSTGTTVSGLLGDLNDSTADIDKLLQNSTQNLSDLDKALSLSAEAFTASADKLDGVIDKLDKVANTDSVDELNKLLSIDPAEISSFLTAPVVLDTRALYPVENYGSAMTPFYTILALWVAGIVCVAMLKTDLSRDRKRRLHNLTNRQMYMGRYVLFLVVSIMQSLLVCSGDLFFLRIQCVHPGYFMLAGVFAGIVFGNIMYTLTISFGDIGKAIAVVLLVIQVGGSGGTFPTEMTPAFFRAVYPLMPFVHGMNAMRECIAGFYGLNYWKEMGILAIYLGLSLVLGLVLRNPIIKVNRWITEKLEETKVM